VGGEIANIGAALTGLGAATAAPAAIAAAVVAMGAAAVAGANDMQRMVNQLTLMTGSAEATQAVIANLKQYALDTPFEIPQLIQTAGQLQAAGLKVVAALSK
jgi:phage tail tape-measure protein